MPFSLLSPSLHTITIELAAEIDIRFADAAASFRYYAADCHWCCHAAYFQADLLFIDRTLIAIAAADVITPPYA